MSSVIVDEMPGSVLLVGADTGVVVSEQEKQTVVVAPAEQGPPGPPGPAGAQDMQRIAGELLSALCAVYEAPNGQVNLASSGEADQVFAVLGITLTSAVAGQPVNVQRAGVVEDAGWAWTEGQRVFLAANGALTQTAPEHGYDVLIGVALSATRLLLSLSDPIALE